MKQFRSAKRIATVVLTAVAGVAGLAVAAEPPAPTVLQADNAKIVAKDSGHVELYVNDHPVMTITGYHILWSPNIKTTGGELHVVKLPDGQKALKINYALDQNDNGKIRLEATLSVKPGHITVQFDAWGLPEKNRLGGSMLGRVLDPGLGDEQLFKMGRWVRDAHGGIPYEVQDGTLYRHAAKDAAIWISMPHSHADWHAKWGTHLPLQKIDKDHYRAVMDVMATGSSVRAEAAAAMLNHRPVSLAIWTDHAYNWWMDAAQPMQVRTELANVSPSPQSMEFKYVARNFDGKVVAQGHQRVDLKAGQVEDQVLRIQPGREREIIFLEVAAEPISPDAKAAGEIFSRTNLVVLPPHTFESTPSDSIFGLSAGWKLPTEADYYKLLQRMGVRWLRNADARETMKHGINANHHTNVHPYDKYAGNDAVRDEWIRKQLEVCDAQQNPYWEFANEWNLGGDRAGGNPKIAAVYVEYLKAIHRIKEQMHANVKIMSMGIGGMDVKFVRNIHDDGGWDLFDAFALHPGRGNFTVDYPVQIPWDKWVFGSHGNYWNFLGSVREAKSLLKEYGEKPLWLTEVYACTYPNSFWEDSFRHAAENTVMTYAIGLAEGAKCVEFYQLNDSVWYNKGGIRPDDREYSFGLLNRDYSFKPSLMAYCAIAENLDKATFVRWLHFGDSQSMGLLFDTPRGPLAILWNRADGYVLSKDVKPFASPEPWVDQWKTKTQIELPAVGSTVRTLNCIGQSTQVHATDGKVSLTLDGAPLMVYGLAGY